MGSTIQVGERGGGEIQKAVHARGKYFIFTETPLMLKVSIRRFKHYVELVEPGGPSECIRCCDDFDDCPVNKGGFTCFDSGFNRDLTERRHRRMPPGYSWELLQLWLNVERLSNLSAFSISSTMDRDTFTTDILYFN